MQLEDLVYILDTVTVKVHLVIKFEEAQSTPVAAAAIAAVEILSIKLHETCLRD